MGKKEKRAKPPVPQQSKEMNLVWRIDTPEPLQILYTEFTGIYYAWRDLNPQPSVPKTDALSN